MRLATIASGASTAAAVLADNSAIPIADYADVGALLRDGDAGLEAARAAERAGEPVSIEPHDLRMPVLAPGAVICVGLNYRAHILEMGRELPDHPTLFAKLTRSLTDPYADIRLPPISTQVDYEGELVIVIGRAARDVPDSRAHEHIAGFMLMNDVSMRDFQYRTLQWFAGKNFERSTPVGPWITTADGLPELGTLELRTLVNGDVRQQASLGDLVFSPAQLVADASSIMTLEPGDLIATGTPGGVGHGMTPKGYMADGDEVEVQVVGLGSLRNRFRADS
jgi:acylpyruvate hydrolase